MSVKSTSGAGDGYGTKIASRTSKLSLLIILRKKIEDCESPIADIIVFKSGIVYRPLKPREVKARDLKQWNILNDW